MPVNRWCVFWFNFVCWLGTKTSKYVKGKKSSVFLLLAILFVTVSAENFISDTCYHYVNQVAPTPNEKLLPFSPTISLPGSCPLIKDGVYFEGNNSAQLENPVPCTSPDGFVGKMVPGWGYKRFALVQNGTACTFSPAKFRECLGPAVLFIIGDSMLRQLFVRLIALFRQQEQVVDYSVHIHAVYEHCGDSDFFLAFGQWSKHGATIPPHEVPFPAGNNGCLQVQSLFAVSFEHQRRLFVKLSDHYLKGKFFILGVHFWESRATVPLEYLEQLERLSSHARHVSIVGAPTIKAGHLAASLRARNLQMQKWVEEHRKVGRPTVSYIDFDTLARFPGAPPGVVNNNWHYQCFLVPINIASTSSTNWWVRWPNTSYGSQVVQMREDGTCFDDMNASLWAVLSSSLCI